jgi:hypothetical protein
MNTQNKNSGTVKLGDVWEEISSTRKVHSPTYRETDNITVRIKKVKSGNLSVAIGVGSDICDLVKWNIGDKINIFRNKVNGTMLKLAKSPDENGSKLHAPNLKYVRLMLVITFQSSNKYLLDTTKICSFDIDKNSVIIDITPLCKE